MSYTKTYSELRQAALLKCSRELRAVACMILNDVINDVELTGTSAPHMRQLAQRTADQADSIESDALELAVLYGRSESDIRKSRRLYRDAVNAFERRVAFAESLKKQGLLS